MNKLFITFLFLVLLRRCDGSKTTLPVLVFDHDKVMSRMIIEPNPFEITSSEFFIEVISLAIEVTECVIIFIENTLCTEDITLKDRQGTPFSNLHSGVKDKKVIYIPAVNEPFELLKEMLDPHVFNVFHLGPGEKLKMPDALKYLYVYFKNGPEMSRLEKLRNHDMLMNEVYFTVRQIKSGPILAFYTGDRNPITMRQLNDNPFLNEEIPKERGVKVVTKEVLFRLSGVFSSSETRRSMFEETPFVEYEMRTRRTLSTTMLVSDYHLQFNFEFEDEKWDLANVALLEAGEEVGRTETVISAPWRRSYYCSEPITIFNMRDGSSITISEYQIEPLPQDESFRKGGDDSFVAGNEPVFREEGELPTKPEPKTIGTTTMTPGYCYFSKAINCGPYFNTVILTGWFTTGIFTIITFWGVIMLLNCGRNDRYDDPNQKPLVVVQESGHHGGL